MLVLCDLKTSGSRCEQTPHPRNFHPRFGTVHFPTDWLRGHTDSVIVHLCQNIDFSTLQVTRCFFSAFASSRNVLIKIRSSANRIRNGFQFARHAVASVDKHIDCTFSPLGIFYSPSPAERLYTQILNIIHHPFARGSSSKWGAREPLLPIHHAG